MNRLGLTATIGAVLVAAILGLIYAVSIQDRDDESTAQPQSSNPPTAAPAQNTAQTQPAPFQPAQNTATTAPAAAPQPTQNTATTQPAPTANTAQTQTATTTTT